MTQDADKSEREAKLQNALDKLQRRQARNERTAWADGFLTAVCGLLRPGDLVLDLGANAGDISARLLATGADVIAFDPEPWAVKKLQERFAGEARFQLHNAAVGVKDGTITMYRASNFDGNQRAASVKSTVISGGRMIEYDPEDTVEVEMIDFVAFLKKLEDDGRPVAFLKMDIEGSELDVLRAMDEADMFRNIRCCVVETHERKFKELRPAFRALKADFAKKYRPEHVNLNWI